MALFPKERDLTRPLETVELLVRGSDFRVRPAELKIRLDAFLLKHLHWRSRTSIQALVREGFVAVAAPGPESRGPCEPQLESRPSRLLRDGARVVITIPEELRLPAVSVDHESLVVLYEDEHVLAVDKPPFLPVHPSGRHLSDTLIQRIHARYAQELDGEDRERRIPVRLCHRLDRETSGVVLCGKTRRGHRQLMKQFERRQVHKEYLAIVHGRPAREAGTITLGLGPSHTSEVHLKIAVSAEGWPSETEWNVLEDHGEYALLACRPLTGRQHQIRVHLAAIGHPIVGDKLYGPDEAYFLRASAGELTADDLRVLEHDRQALHNHRIGFRSPDSGEKVEVESPLAEDLRQFLEGRQGG